MPAANDKPNVALTKDDKTILLEVYQNDIIDADSLCGLLSHRASASLRVRIRTLAKAGYISELTQPIYRKGGGSYSKRYRLADLGARHLADAREILLPTTRWHTKNKELTTGHIKHRLKETSFLMQLRGSIAKRDDISFYYPRDIYKHFKPDVLKKMKLPAAMRTKVNWFGHQNIEATNWDRFCMLNYSQNPKGKQNRFLFIEIDMGTETINPTGKVMRGMEFWRGSSLMRKWVVYGSAFANLTHRAQFGIPTFQVLHVTTTPQRVQEMIEAYQDRLTNEPLKVAPARFLFTDFQTIGAYSGDILETPILNGMGETMMLGATL